MLWSRNLFTKTRIWESKELSVLSLGYKLKLKVSYSNHFKSLFIIWQPIFGLCAFSLSTKYKNPLQSFVTQVLDQKLSEQFDTFVFSCTFAVLLREREREKESERVHMKIEDLGIYFLKSIHILMHPLVHGRTSNITRGQLLPLEEFKSFRIRVTSHLRTWSLDLRDPIEITEC